MYPLFYTRTTMAVRSSVFNHGCYCKTWCGHYRSLNYVMPVCSSRRSFQTFSKSVEPTLTSYYPINHLYMQNRNFYVSPTWNGHQEHSSKVEETVKNIKEQKEQSEKEKLAVRATNTVAESPTKAVAVKRTIWQKVKAEILHYYHGFRLLGLDMKVSAKLIWRILRGKDLSRREHRLLIKTTGDVFRLIPFSVFIIVPFMELLLPVAIKLFPGLLPSTFQTATEKEDKLKQALKVKLEVAKFLQKTLDDMAVQSSDRNSEKAKEFSDFFYKIRLGAVASNEEIMKFSKQFEDEITLDSLSRPQLIALCRVVDVQTLGTTNFLRFQLRMKLRSLAADDRMIDKEGVESLTRAELQQACRARGMRAYGMPDSRLREQLAQWLDLSLGEKVPPTLLLLSRALMVSDTIPTSDKLKATISALPDTVVTRTKGAISEKEGKVDHRTNIEIIKEEERKIEEERQEKRQESIPKPSMIDLTLQNQDEITTKDVKVLEEALDNLGKEKQMAVEKEEIKELKEEMAEYQEDIQELYKMKAQAKGEADIEGLKVSKGAKRLFTKVNKMIGKMDAVLAELEQSEKKIKEKIEELSSEEKKDSHVTAELVKIDELIAAIKRIQSVPDDSRLTRIAEILGKIDDDRDGAIKIEDVLRVVELIGQEDVKLSKKQMDELIELMDKEEVLEVEEQIQKALKKIGIETKEATEPIHEDVEKIVQASSQANSVEDNATVQATETKITKVETKTDNKSTSSNERSDLSQPMSVTKPESRDVRDPTVTTVTSSVPPPPKKAEGSKQL
ncbi:mitochondrial proton/calcium exchanger protein [Diprion similis]|uniref:mitochondrial proton/calcium exchanger protein n=1 Tax=Diprion similis TaxID=362088 RepID=UPI001EF87153|nr:mitochondrial proton/calcium exchanger protein [Diprion similis]